MCYGNFAEASVQGFQSFRFLSTPPSTDSYALAQCHPIKIRSISIFPATLVPEIAHPKEPHYFVRMKRAQDESNKLWLTRQARINPLLEYGTAHNIPSLEKGNTLVEPALTPK